MADTQHLMTFYGSCGHVEVSEITSEAFDNYVTKPGYSAVSELPPCYSVECSDGSCKMVYVYPGRYCACLECIKAACGDW